MNSNIEQMNVSILQLNQAIQALKQNKITCGEDVKNTLLQVQEYQDKIMEMLDIVKQIFDSRAEEVNALKHAVSNLEQNAERKVRLKSTVEKCTIFVISWWWVYLMVDKYLW